MVHSAFLVVPTSDPTIDEDWSRLDRGGRLERLRRRLAELGAQIGARLPGCDLEYMEGTGAWTVRSPVPTERDELAGKLADLPVEVATDDRFYAL